MTTATLSLSTSKRANRIGINCEHYEEAETSRAVVRERIKFDMVHHLRAMGRPARPTELGDIIGASALIVSRIAHEAPRTFVVNRSSHKGAARSGMANIEISLHPHLA